MQTIQTEAVLAAARRLGHASNLEVHADVHEQLPRLSLASVHRITTRLVERGLLALGPSDGHNVVLDGRTDPHDHFVCTQCGGIVDLDLPETVIAAIQEQLGRHLVRDGIVIRGRCHDCSARDTGRPTP